MESTPYLPTDLQRQVLLRVAFESLKEMKAVCRSWKAMISSPEFYEDRKTHGTSERLICVLHSNLDRKVEYGLISTTEFTLYDPIKGTRERIPPIPNDSLRLPETSVFVCVNGKLVLLGAGSYPIQGRATKMVFIYDFQRSEWRRGADMLCARLFFAYSVSSKGLIYVAGGNDEHGNTVATAEVYNVEEDTWTVLPSMTQNREGCIGVFMEGKFIVISGTNKDLQPPAPYTSAEVFDAETGTWNTLDDMWISDKPLGCCQKFISTGGNLYAIDVQQVKKYDAQNNLWTSVAFLDDRFSIITSVAAWRDQNFVSGINDGLISYLFQPSTGQWIAMDCVEGFARCVNRSAATLEI